MNQPFSKEGAIVRDRSEILTAVVATARGEICDLEGYGAAGSAGDHTVVLTRNNTMPLPHGSELMLLPHRRPVVYDMAQDRFVTLNRNPFARDEPIFPVAAFVSPGHVTRLACAYEDRPSDPPLPLFSYAAAGFGAGGFYAASFQVDAEPRQDLRQMSPKKIMQGVRRMRHAFPDNRLMRHLETCALQYGCPAGKNFFLQRYEAPLPTSRVCNARCLGCISLQTDSGIHACQERIAFTPTPEEIAQVCLTHIGRVSRAVVSFGQGCEGEPLTAVSVMAPAIRLVREQTREGTINLNTNASLPDAVRQVCQAGLDTLRVSVNSVRENAYTAYFRPVSYTFSDVRRSIDTARQSGVHVALNYLNCPGVTDSDAEVAALTAFIRDHDIGMIQWRNLNFDPRRYFQIMDAAAPGGAAMGMDRLIRELSRKFPRLIHGYFNPPRETYESHH